MNARNVAITATLASGTEQMTLVAQYLEYNRVYARELMLDYQHLQAIGAPAYLVERKRLELASLGMRP